MKAEGRHAKVKRARARARAHTQHRRRHAAANTDAGMKPLPHRHTDNEDDEGEDKPEELINGVCTRTNAVRPPVITKHFAAVDSALVNIHQERKKRRNRASCDEQRQKAKLHHELAVVIKQFKISFAFGELFKVRLPRHQFAIGVNFFGARSVGMLLAKLVPTPGQQARAAMRFLDKVFDFGDECLCSVLYPRFDDENHCKLDCDVKLATVSRAGFHPCVLVVGIARREVVAVGSRDTSKPSLDKRQVQQRCVVIDKLKHKDFGVQVRLVPSLLRSHRHCVYEHAFH